MAKCKGLMGPVTGGERVNGPPT